MKNSYYFISDIHFGLLSKEKEVEREMVFVEFLYSIRDTAKELYILGDLFDYWFEYKKVIQKGYFRTFTALNDLVLNGTKVHYIIGNHDFMHRDFFEKEIGVTLYQSEIILQIDNKKFYLAHGDGFGPGDLMYKILKKIFASRVSQWLFARFHPNLGIGIANLWSTHSRYSRETRPFEGEDKEWLILYSKELLEKEHFDFLIYGHRHSPLDLKLKENSRYINLGDWLSHYTYAEFDGEEMYLKKYTENNLH